jgi:hypothetical protein
MRETIGCKPCKKYRAIDSIENLSRVVLLFLFVFPCISLVGWEPDFRLTYDPALSLTCFTNARCVAVSGDTIHVVWADFNPSS